MLDVAKECKWIKRGELLFQEGSYPRGLYCVHSGKIKVFQMGTDSKEQIVHLVHDGDVMGYRAMLSDDVYSCSAAAMEDSQVCFIPKADFYQLLEKHPKLLLKITQLLAHKLKEAEQKITQMAHQPVKERLIQVLFSLIDNYGFKADKITIDLMIKREDIANLVGTTRETAIRLLYDLQTQKIVELDGKYIKILDEKALKKGLLYLV
ncbi:MAG: Crp/Fnr family transcriptional regulator [Bacteroidia bacterium]